MATPESPDQMAQFIDAAASQQMGVPPQQQAAPQQQSAPDQDTAQDKASEKGAPKTEADRQGDDPVVYSVDFGDGKKRDFTPNQIKGTMERYAALNHRNAQLAPIHSVIEKLTQAHPDLSPKQLAAKLEEVYSANEKNTTLGHDSDGNETGKNAPKPQTAEDISAQLSQWEEENAVTLPPGYKEMMANSGEQMRSMQGQMQQMAQMLRQVVSQAGGTADAAREAYGEAEGQRSDAIRQQIATNIDRIQQHLQLPDEAANDFMMFAAERGFTMEDFVDPQLTYKVMQDFQRNMQSPEMDRLRQIAQRRQAYTGSMGASPAAGGAGGGAEPSSFDQFANSIMAQKGLA
jgi:hypothetical protein